MGPLSVVPQQWGREGWPTAPMGAPDTLVTGAGQAEVLPPAGPAEEALSCPLGPGQTLDSPWFTVVFLNYDKIHMTFTILTRLKYEILVNSCHVQPSPLFRTRAFSSSQREPPEQRPRIRHQLMAPWVCAPSVRICLFCTSRVQGILQMWPFPSGSFRGSCTP